MSELLAQAKDNLGFILVCILIIAGLSLLSRLAERFIVDTNLMFGGLDKLPISLGRERNSIYLLQTVQCIVAVRSEQIEMHIQLFHEFGAAVIHRCLGWHKVCKSWFHGDHLPTYADEGFAFPGKIETVHGKARMLTVPTGIQQSGTKIVDGKFQIINAFNCGMKSENIQRPLPPLVKSINRSFLFA